MDWDFSCVSVVCRECGYGRRHLTLQSLSFTTCEVVYY